MLNEMQHELNNVMTRRFFITIWLFFIISVSAGQSYSAEFPQNQPAKLDTADVGQNELTIYVIPSKVKYDWTSPRSLCKSFFRNYKCHFFNKERYLLGHAFVELQSPLASGRIFSGMTTDSKDELKNFVFKQHYGLAILGADTKGKLETENDLELKVQKYSRNGQLAFMTFIISNMAAERMIRFFQSYKAGIDSNGSPGARYGGAFWPRYKGEGSGCSAFVISFLDLAGILKEEFDEWLVKVDIPMELIGGPYNNYKDVRFKDIKKHRSWASWEDPDKALYEHLEMYDPTLIYEWILEMWDKHETQDAMIITPVQLDQAKGVRIDERNLPVPEEDSIFIERKTPSIFIDYYHQKYAAGR
jgi:hypothetical protein